MRITASQNVLLYEIDPANKAEIQQILVRCGIKREDEIDSLVRDSMACPALPTCGLATTESERVMPSVLERIRLLLDRVNLPNEHFIVRMTGCPNGCARPYLAEVAFVGNDLVLINFGWAHRLIKLGWRRCIWKRCRLTSWNPPWSRCWFTLNSLATSPKVLVISAIASAWKACISLLPPINPALKLTATIIVFMPASQMTKAPSSQRSPRGLQPSSRSGIS